jgi:hypothetical protein
MKGSFKVIEYTIGMGSENKEVMIIKLAKETETSSIVKSNAMFGFAGTMELFIYDEARIEEFKEKVGKTIEVYFQ